MNSLAYLTRQFDALASAKTPPSTPTADHPPKRNRSEPSFQRVSSWTATSLLFPQPSTGVFQRRSPSLSSFVSLHKVPPPLVLASAGPSDLRTQARSETNVRKILQRIFFIRVFSLVWERLQDAWLSLRRRRRLQHSSLDGRPEHVRKGDFEGEISFFHSAEFQRKAMQSSPPVDSKPLPPATIPLPHNVTLNLRSSESSASPSRSPTPVLAARKTPFHQPKTLVLDLDETLIHSTSRPMNSLASGRSGFFGLGSFGGRNKGASHMVEVVLGGRSTLYHVYKRPFVDFFLRTVSGWYTLVIFTASMQEYADPVIDWLDAGRGILTNRFFRDSCTQLPNGSFTKDLSVIEADLSRVCLVDNSPISYRVNEANGIPIEGWTHDPHDEALLDLLPVLDSLRFTSDVRRVLGLRTAGVLS